MEMACLSFFIIVIIIMSMSSDNIPLYFGFLRAAKADVQVRQWCQGSTEWHPLPSYNMEYNYSQPLFHLKLWSALL